MASSFPVPVNGTYDVSATLLGYTYVYNRFMCITWVYPFHIAFAYLVVLSGAFALLARVVQFLKPYHGLFGRLYLIFMFWCMASSLLIFNTGLPFPIIVSFLYLLGGITVGWLAIYKHNRNFEQTLWQRLESSLKEALAFGGPVDLQKLKREETASLIQSKTFTQRFFSLKTLHGMLLSFSWFQMLGRTVVTNPSTSWHGCWTYPAYKNPAGIAVFVNATEPGYFPMGEGNFLIAITVPIVLLILIVALSVSAWNGREARRRTGSTGGSASRGPTSAASAGKGEAPTIELR